MLDINFIRQNSNKVKEGCWKKQVKVDIDKLLELDKKRRELLKKSEDLRTEQNKINKELADTNNGIDLNLRVGNLKQQIKKIEPELKNIEQEFNDLMLQVPNIPQEDVPEGKDEEENVVIKKVGKVPTFNFKPKDHLEIGESLDLIGVKRAAKVSGIRFNYLKNEAVLLEFALINFIFESLIKKRVYPDSPASNDKIKNGNGNGIFRTNR